MVWVGRFCTMEWAHSTREHIKGSRSRPHSIRCLMVSIRPRLFQSVTGVPKQQFTPVDWASCCSIRWEWLLSGPVLECNWCSAPVMHTSGTGRTKSGTNRWQPIVLNEDQKNWLPSFFSSNRLCWQIMHQGMISIIILKQPELVGECMHFIHERWLKIIVSPTM